MHAQRQREVAAGRAPHDGTKARVLFVTWDGPQVNYLESLFAPIFARLRDHGYPFDVLQFRWGEPGQQQAVARACADLGVGYMPVQIWRFGGSAGPALSALAGARHIRRAIRHFGSTLIMPRTTFPAIAMTRGGIARDFPVVMDADGLEIDERVEGGTLASTSATYRFMRDAESQMVRQARTIIVRTAVTADILVARAGPPVRREQFHVVTNGRDEDAFTPFDEATRQATRRELGVDADAPLVVYVGSVGARYRTPAVGEFALKLRARYPRTRLLVMTGNPEEARAELVGRSPELDAFTTITRVDPDDVPRHLAAADVGTAFIKSTFATQGVAPVKVGEYLLCGVPVVGAAAVGRNERAVAGGVFFDDVAGLDRAVEWVSAEVLPRREEFRAKSRAIGVEAFSLGNSVREYRDALDAAMAFRAP